MFSTGTVASVRVCHKNVRGMCAETSVSSENLRCSRSIFTCQTHKAAAVCIRSRRDHRIAQHRRIRSVRLQIRARRKPVCVVPRRRQQSRQMGARRKSADRNAVCRDAELCRMFSHPGDRRGQRVQRLHAKRHLRAVVLEHERFHAVPRECTRDRCALPDRSSIRSRRPGTG